MLNYNTVDLASVTTEIDKEDAELFELFKGRDRRRCDDLILVEQDEQPVYLVAKGDLARAAKGRQDLAKGLRMILALTLMISALPIGFRSTPLSLLCAVSSFLLVIPARTKII